MVKAATDLEALELIEHLLANTDILDFTPEDVGEIDVRCAADAEDRCCLHEECGLHCTTCGGCMADEDNMGCAGCEDCEYQCPECGSCLHEDEDSGIGQTMQTAVREINTEYQDRLDEIKNSQSYDVLAVYAVKTTTDPENAQEVATVDDGKKQLLKDIFWEMNEISSRTETKTETVIGTTDDGHGNIVETETSATRTYLYITVSHKTAEEMADRFSFSADQRKQMAELLADEHNSMWSAVIYGIGTGDGKIVTVALSQVGNIGGEPYWSWYGFDSRVEWCACFVSWCAEQCGYIEAGVIPKFAACASQGVPWFQERGQWQDNSYEPQPGW